MRARGAVNALITSGWTGVMSSWALGHQIVRPDPRALESHTRIWAGGLARGLGVAISGHDTDRIPRGERLVLMANHQSHSDVVALFLSLPELPVFLAKKELRRVPVFGRVMESAGHVFIDRSKHASAVDTIGAAARSLRPGHPLLVFPEGTRGRRPEIAPFKKGGFHLARQAGAGIVPIGIRGSREVWPRERGYAMPGRITVHVGHPIPAADVSGPPLEQVIARVRAEIAALAELPLAPER